MIHLVLLGLQVTAPDGSAPPSVVNAPPLGVGEAIDLLSRGQYLALAALAIGVLIRMLKSPSLPPFLQRIPPKARPAIAVLLGVLLGVVDALARGTRWREALFGGLISAAFAIAGHDVFIEWLRGGKEIAPAVVEKKVVVEAPPAAVVVVEPAPAEAASADVTPVPEPDKPEEKT